ncbi:hypothetical protein GCM10018965_044170 [Nonomuraea roseola]
MIGGGQAGLAAGYYLRRAKADFVILDAQEQHAWPSLPSSPPRCGGWLTQTPEPAPSAPPAACGCGVRRPIGSGVPPRARPPGRQAPTTVLRRSISRTSRQAP